MCDFQVDWVEPIIVKKLEQAVSDLQVTGQWVTVVHHMMDNTGVL
jgi:hypothetical protein